MFEKNTRGRTERRRKAAAELLDGIETGGVPGLAKTMYRMIGQNQPSIDCFRQAQDAFEGAANVEDDEHLESSQVWDAALGFADCLRDALIEPETPETPPPPPEDPHPDPPPHDPRDRLSDVVFAALLVHLQREHTKSRLVQQQEMPRQ